MTLTVNHSTPADGSFSATGATAWNASHTLSGTIDVANGGTGQTTTTAAINALLPTQATNSGKYLTTDGTNTSWAPVSGSGTVTSVALSAPSIFTVTGSPITTSGTLAISYSGTALPVANGGSGATTLTGVLKGNGTSAFSAATAGTDYQAPITLTTTGTSGAATFVGNTLNIPQYTGGGGGSGTVTTVSVVSANGLAGTVANATTTPAITLSTSITGVLKGNGTAISAATANTDYQSPITLTTTGTSGAATFNGTTLNIPQYTGGGGGGTPGGSTTQVQFNNAGAFGGSANFTWDGTNAQIGATGALRFADSDSSNYVSFKAPASIGSNVNWTLPSTDGTNGQVLGTNGSGVLSWVSAAPTAPTSVEYLVVAGGGGGGGGGGGAGGFLTATGFAVTTGSPLTVTVGAGGAGGANGNLVGVSGSNSVFSSITATGGGGGGAGFATTGFNGLNGGSGGGGGTNSATGGTPGTAGTGTSGQGNAGGIAFTGGFTAGGGGGAGAAGISAPSASATGTGGAGLSSSITGSSTFYAGGGGPANSPTNPIAPGLGGNGGGGAGQQVGSAYPTGQSGATNFGGGGGGGYGGAGVTGSGGSGVVIIAYPDTYNPPSSISGGLTYDQPTRSGYRVYRFTAGTGTITW